ncbi:MAG: TRAP transporter fused permease subunit [Treponema sp.]|jgi:TRAP transporter 4TM/12TM fusion protein|nr:TRAP transporter fused permease subunit [Treponema sp.]
MAQDKMEKWRYTTLIVLSAVFLCFELYIGVIRPLPLISNPIHLSLALIVTFLVQPLAKKYGKSRLWLIDAALIILAAVIAFYFILDEQRLTYRVMIVDKMLPIDLFCAFALFGILMEAVRRTLGLNLFIFILFFVAYAFFGQYLTGPFRYSGMTWQQFGEMLTLTPDGIFGSPLSTSVNTLFYFLLFGAFFASCGGGDVLIDLGMKLSDKTAGGPAKAAVVSSGLMGMISGSAVANVTTTGVITIPLMKKTGYTPEEAGAVESVASTGGQIMPPIMGVGAFIMAEMIGISYARIAVSAIIPALAYYLGIFLIVHFIAKKRNLMKQNANVKVNIVPMLPRLYRLIPIILVVVMIFMGSSLTRAALVGVILSVVINLISKKIRMNFMGFVDTMLDGIRQAASIAIPTAACGIMIGIVVRSGAANKLTTIIATVGGSNLLVALILAMIGCLILGMALPTVAAYLIANILFCPTLIALGIPSLQANMFIFYFGVIAQITPPVCLASFTAAGIANADSWKTGWKAFTYVIVTFLVPYIFVFQPSVLLIGTPGEITYVCVVLIVATTMLAAGITGYLFGKINWMFRIILLAGAVCVAIPESITDIIGFIIAVVIGIITFLISRRGRTAASPGRG